MNNPADRMADHFAWLFIAAIAWCVGAIAERVSGAELIKRTPTPIVAPAEAPTLPGDQRYACLVKTWTGEDPAGLGWRLQDKGHTPLAQQVRQTVAKSGRAPDYLVVHAVGAGEVIAPRPPRPDGRPSPKFNYEMVFDGYTHADYPKLRETLGEWPRLAAEWRVAAWVYLGRAENQRLREMLPSELIDVVHENLDIVAKAGFHGVFIDSSSNGWGANQYALREAVAYARELGLQVGGEAWPHAENAHLFDGVCYLEHRSDDVSAWRKQHPFFGERPEFNQAPADDFVGLIHVMHHGGEYQLTPALAREVKASRCMVGVPWQAWGEVAWPDMGPRLEVRQ